MSKLLSIKEVKDILGIGLNQTYKLAKTQAFPTITIGNSIKVDEEGLQKWIEQNMGKTICLKEV